MKFPIAVRRFLIGYLILHLLAVGLFVFVLTRMARNQMIVAAQSRMSAMTTMLSEHIRELEFGLDDPSLADHVEKIGDQTQMRFTLIRSDGLVVADTNTGQRDIGPHGTREEVLLAKENEVGFSERYSATLNKPMMYLARRLDSSDSQQPAGFVRVATPSVSISASIRSIQKYVWLFALLLSGLTALLMSLFAAKSMQPLSRFAAAAKKIGIGDYTTSSSVAAQGRKDEWGELGDAFQQMQTELNRREQRMLQNSQRLEAVLSSMIEGVIALDPTGKVMLANGAACDMLVLTRPEIVRKRLFEIVRIPELREAIEHTQEHKTFSKTEFETLAKPPKTLSARVSNLEDNNKPGVVVVLHEITALRQLETMRQDFVANVSHELKTPLASIKAYAETLRLGAINDDEKNMEFLAQIEFQADLLNRQIQDLIELAKVEADEAVFSIGDVEINAVCQSCFDQFLRTASERNIELKLDLSQPGPVARADTDATATIVKNLVVNAIHYTPDGGSVTISTTRENDNSVIRVVDTGIGIAKDQQARVFERFYRVDKARSRDMGGTGLGLAIVKHLSQAFGGSVEVQSQIGKGSTFIVTLPCPLP